MLTVRMCASTLKPVPDKWIAKDGCDVVLNATSSELLLLRYDESGWTVSRHEAVTGSTFGGSSFEDAIEVHGSRYSARGTNLHVLTLEDSAAVWKAVYRTLLRV